MVEQRALSPATDEVSVRETIHDAAKRLLTEPVGTERNILINISDGLTGLPPGPPARGSRQRTVAVRVEVQTRDDKKRIVVKDLGKGAVVAAGTWTSSA